MPIFSYTYIAERVIKYDAIYLLGMVSASVEENYLHDVEVEECH